MKLLKIKGILADIGKIRLETMKFIQWNELSKDPVPQIPLGSSIELTIAFDENEFISGKNGIVWATYDSRQAEIIRNALLTLHINSEIRELKSFKRDILLIKVMNENEITDAVEYIWKSDSGLRLKPDWSYPEGEKNKSFEKWIS